jgi:chemotaxis protein methyltransferase CheR
MENVYDISRNIHAIFCRNVMIYFEREVQEELLFKLCHHLIPGGYLFTGHAETLRGTTLPLIPVAPAVYRKQT